MPNPKTLPQLKAEQLVVTKKFKKLQLNPNRDTQEFMQVVLDKEKIDKEVEAKEAAE